MSKALALALCCVLLLGGCRHPEPERPADDELRRTMESGRKAFERGQTEEAARVFEQALERARLTDRHREIGNAAYNLGLVLINMGDYSKAQSRLHEAQAELARAGENLADVLLVRARLAQFQEDYSGLAHLAEQALTHPQSQPSPAHRVQALVLQGMAQLHQGSFPEAEQRLEQAMEAMPSDPALPLRALVAGLEGELLRYQKQSLAAAKVFDEETRLWQGAELYGEMAAALRRAGEMWMEAGEARKAADRLFRAARSFAGRNLIEPALASLGRAETAAALAEDEWLVQQIADLQKRLQQDVESRGGSRTSE